ncbi:hypothetical protein BDB00DRAFT_797317 [Zychaea mexicana]|uniref:uncharacterized protein n=1 Tax=Zychaea mexicana TaxID=64656 RepID=UPI0022FECE7D|nr:uncharacterized protein BDB00DRAFT_797317 [Zychaea mexicana]KAI9498924.1 hypothetical protein BDB00DRAFT_797317 [Zychaea mexicana]
MKRYQYEVLYAVSPPPSLRPQMAISTPIRKHKPLYVADDNPTPLLITWSRIYGKKVGNERQPVQYLAAKQRNPACNIKPNSALFKFVGQPLLCLQQRTRVCGSYFGDLSFVRQAPKPVDDAVETSFTTAPSRGIKRPRNKIHESSPTPPHPPARKQSWPNALDYLKMVEKDLGI